MLNVNNVLVTGLARDVAKHIPKEIMRLEIEMKKIFNSVNFFIVESDSSDETIKSLENIKKDKDNFDYISLGNLEKIIPNRIQRLSYCRNIYVKKIRDDPTSHKFNHIAVVDFDIKNNYLNLSILKEFVNNNSWSGLFSNQKGFYYDIYALRCSNWSENDCFEEYRLLCQKYNSEKAKKIAIWSKMRKISESSAPIMVDSAFGGFAVYKKNIFLEFDYADNLKKFINSEHVVLNKKITQNGGKLFILPSMTNFSWNPHNLSKIRLFRVLDSSTKLKGLKIIRRFFRNRLS